MGTTQQKPEYRSDIQGLRALAVILVVIFHSRLGLPGGFVGVDVFFVISGFVIGRLLLSELHETGRISLRAFYARRVRRLLPLLTAVIVAGLIGAVLVLSPFGAESQQLSIKTGLAATVFSANWFLAFTPDTYFAPIQDSNVFLHLWSLSVEEQFYLLLPAFLTGTWRMSGGGRSRASTRTLAASVLFVSLASFALSVAHGHGFSLGLAEGTNQLGFFGTHGRIWELGAGVLLAIAGAAPSRLPSWLLTVSGAAGTLMVGVAAFVLNQSDSYPGTDALLPVGGTVLLLVASSGPTIWRRTLSFRPLVWVGDRSYGWYLWHWPCIVLAREFGGLSRYLSVLAAVASLALAAATFQLIENRYRHDQRLSGTRSLRFAGMCIAVPLVVGAYAFIGSFTDWGLEPIDADERGAMFSNGCFGIDEDPTEFPAEQCTFPASDAKGTILLVGDSHAAAAGLGIVDQGNALGYDVAVWARSACPFLISAPSANPSHPNCTKWITQAFALISEMKPDLVMVANFSTSHTVGALDVDTTEALSEWSNLLDQTLLEITTDGIPVLIVGEIPTYRSFPNPPSIVRPNPRVPQQSLEALRLAQLPLVLAEEAVVDRYDRAERFDTVGWLCGATTCMPYANNHWLYYDNFHLNKFGSSELAGPTLEQSMRRLLTDPAP